MKRLRKNGVLILILALFGFIGLADILPVRAQVVARKPIQRVIVGEDDPIYQKFADYMISINTSDDVVINYLKDGLDLRRAATFMEKYGKKLSKKLEMVSDYQLGKFVTCSKPIIKRLADLGFGNRNLKKFVELFQKRIYKREIVKKRIPHRRIIAIKRPAKTIVVKNDSEKLENTRFFLENKFFISSNNKGRHKLTDLLKLTMVGRANEGKVNYRLSFQNRDRDDHFYSFIDSPEYSEYITEAFVSLNYPKLPYKRIDIGRYNDSMFFGGLYSGYTDGIRGTIRNNKLTLTLSADSFEKRLEEIGFSNMDLSLFDTIRGKVKYKIEDGNISLEAMRINLKPGIIPEYKVQELKLNNGSIMPPYEEPNWYSISSNNYPTMMGVVSDQFSSFGASFEKKWNENVETRGFIEYQDMEDFNRGTYLGYPKPYFSSNVMGRNFEGMQYGLDLKYDNRYEGLGDTIFASMRLREIDHINLGRDDSFYDSEYLNNYGLAKNGLGNMVPELYNNSTYFSIGIEHIQKIGSLQNPLHMRLYYESLEGWKDIDYKTAGDQDGVFDQYATGLILEYRNSRDWLFQTRIRSVVYDDSDFEYINWERFGAGNAPRDRIEFDMRITTPLF